MSKIKTEHLGVESSFVASLRYTYASRKLVVLYKSGSAYEYSDVKPSVIKKIRRSNSIGSAFHEYIFNNCNFKKI
jgi:hypothetical protein